MFNDIKSRLINKTIILLLFVGVILYAMSNSPYFLANTMLYPLEVINGISLTESNKDVEFKTTPYTKFRYEIEFTDTPRRVYLNGLELNTQSTYAMDYTVAAGEYNYTINLKTEDGYKLSDSVKQINTYGVVPNLTVDESKIVDVDTTLTTPEVGQKYLYIKLNTSGLDITSNQFIIEFDENASVNLEANFFTSKFESVDYTFENNKLTLFDYPLQNEMYIPINLNTVTPIVFQISGTHTTMYGDGSVVPTKLVYDGANITETKISDNYLLPNASTTMVEETQLMEMGNDYKLEYATDAPLTLPSYYYPGLDFSQTFDITSDESLYFSKFQFAKDQNIELTVPYYQKGEFKPFDFYLVENNGYDVTSNSTYNDFKITSDIDADSREYGSSYQSELANLGYDSALFHIEKDKITISYNNHLLASMGTPVTVYDLDVAITPGLFYYTFKYNFETRELSIQVSQMNLHSELDFVAPDGQTLTPAQESANNANNEIVKYNDLIKVVLPNDDFNPTGFSMYLNNASGNSIYPVLTPNNRYYGTIKYRYSPMQYALPSNASSLPSVSKVLKDAKPYYLGYVNGILTTKLDIDVDMDVNFSILSSIKENSKYPEYNQQLENGKYYITSKYETTYLDQNIEINSSYPFYIGDLPVNDVLVQVKEEVSYPVGVYIDPSQYIGFENVTYLRVFENASDESDGGYTNIESFVNIAAITLQDNFDYNTMDTYSSSYTSEYPDPVTGELLSNTTSQVVSVAQPELDFGDAPSSYGEGGAVANASKSYQIGLSPAKLSGDYYVDPEFYPNYSSDARGDDKTGTSDEYGWFNMNPKGEAQINIGVDSFDVMIPYTANGGASVGIWIDYNQNGIFESSEGQVEHVRGSVPDNANKYHPYYYQQGFTIPTSPTGTTIKPNESTYMRIRIVQGNSLSTSDANVTYKNLPGETEDFKVKFYGATRPSDICTDVSTNSPILLTDRYPTGMDMKNGYYQTLVFTTDVPSYSAPGGVYEDATITVSSSDALTSDGDKSTRALVSDMGGKYTPIENTILVEINQQGNANTIIDVKIRDSDGNPINLPLTFSFIGMDSEYYDSKPEHKHNVDAHPAEYIHFEEEDIFLGGLKLEDFSNTYITDGDLNYLQNLIISPTNGKYNIFDYHFGVSTQTAGMASPSSGLWLRSDQYAQSDIQFTTNGTSIKLLFGLNMENINIPINDCVDGFDPTATLRIIGDDTKYQDLEIYKNYPIEYVSDNIAVPYYENLNNFSFVAEIPDGVEFSDEANKVEVYKRPLVGREPTNDPWTKVDSSDYQLIETEASSEQKSRDILKVVELYFPNAIANDTIGYEYKFKLNIQVSDNYTNKNNGSSVEINDVLKVNSYVYYDKDDYTYLQTNLDPSEYQDENQLDEFYRFNESTITIRRPYELEMETYMGDPNMYITTDQEIADVLTYKYEYNNCKTCTSINEKTAFLSGEEANKYMINIPIADKKDVEFASSDPQDMYEDISISIYDGTYVVSTFNVRRYYPVDLDFEITNLDDIKKVDENLNPVEMYTHIVTGEKKWIEQYYAQEKIKLDSLSTYQNVVDGKLFVSLKPEIILNDVNAPSNWLNIDDTMMKPVTDAKVYAKNTRESVELLLPPELIDTTLSVPISVLNSIEYATIKFSSVEEIEVVDETKKTKYTQSLSSQYVIEEISGRLYNKLESTECGSNVCNLNVLYNVETDDISRINEGYNDMNDKDLVLTNLVSNVFLLARDLELLDRNFDYYIVVRDFGLNKVNLNIKSDFTYSGNMVSYKKNDGHQYFMRAEVSDDNCIQTYTCDSQYKEILSGEITSTQQVKNELLKDDNKMSNYFTNTQWLDFFIR